MKTFFGTLALLATLAPGLTLAQSSQATNPFGTMSFDEFTLLGRESRQEIFELMRPAKRAEIVREHLRRWAVQNDARLNDAQRQFLTDARQWATPEQYAVARSTPERDAQLQQLGATARQLFSPDDLDEILFLVTARDRQQ